MIRLQENIEKIKILTGHACYAVGRGISKRKKKSFLKYIIFCK